MDQDLLLSCMWSNISLTMGREEAQENLDTVVELLNADQIADAESQALEWLAQRGWKSATQEALGRPLESLHDA